MAAREEIGRFRVQLAEAGGWVRTAEKVVEERAAWIAEQAVRIEDWRLPLHLALEGRQPVQQEIPQAPPRPARPRAWGGIQGNNREV
ncbi:hypothetical protein PQG65_08530 [Corynebacterium pseudodiphtheriticum]|uniref:hypothetical protein n=1 Tax=Corynebacterium pseudodiphtheriticum TaxID=37637 RepID=UPI00234CEC96|nr:hypothetical protein [Corynebacterium pseudodiphtheriticum]MDC7111412.1 hypothetical protein [Corynebacterium pseudodiphtheriticum]MDC7115367.1 hypothetical protein [Corynebacterium pseudodiphtheriticum]